MSFQMWGGLLIFYVGMWINIATDSYLTNLKTFNSTKRKKNGNHDKDGVSHSPEEYVIPQGLTFRWLNVSAPHYFGELLQWIGYAVVCDYTIASISFVCFTAGNLIPRAITHHEWYRQRFGEQYPSTRKAIIPGVV
jgi:protein-S-isoprenylcysteine O-methyltransferase Ste14